VQGRASIWPSAVSHRLPSGVGVGSGQPGDDRWMLSAAFAAREGVRLRFRMTAVKGIGADIELLAVAGVAIALPQDLLAVIGWHGSRLSRKQGGWAATVRLRGSGGETTREAEITLTAAARHLARTLAEDPARFHTSWRAAGCRPLARRRTAQRAVAGRRRRLRWGGPVPQMVMQNNSVFRMLVFHTPLLLLLLFFGLGELPRWPRRLTAPV
jgi:hypothetical protein